MMRLNPRLLTSWLKNLEVVITITWLLYFMNVNAPSPIPQLMKALSYGIIIVLVALHWKRLLWVATRDKPLLLLLGFAFASVFWSINLVDTVDGCRGLLRTFLFGAYIATRYSIKEQMKILTWVFGIAAILSLVVPFVVPSYRTVEGWNGIFSHKNILGSTMTIGAILFLISAIKERKPNWLLWGGFALSILLIFLAHSSNALISLFVLLSIMPVYRLIKQQYKLKVILFSLIAMISLSLAILILGNLETILVDILGEGTTFNGRTPIWTLIIEKISERPWLGYGYNAFWGSDAGMHVILNSWASNKVENIQRAGFNAHSGYFEFLAQLGICGILFYSISLITVFLRVSWLLALTKKIEFFWLFQLIIFMCVANFAAIYFQLLASTSSYSSIYVAMCLSTAIEYKRLEARRKYSVVDLKDRIYYNTVRILEL